MYGAVTRPEELHAFDEEKKRLEKPVTLHITIQTGTLEAIYRALRGELYCDVVFNKPVSEEKQEKIRKGALADLDRAINLFCDSSRTYSPKR